MHSPPHSQWHLHGPDALTIPHSRAGIDAVRAWEALGHRGLAEVVIGLVDDSCWTGAPELPGSALAGAAVLDASGLREVPSGSWLTDLAPAGRTHGTSMATLMVGRGPATLGVAPGVRLLPVVVDRSDAGLALAERGLVDALDYLLPQVDVLVLPFGRSPTLLFSRAVVDRLEAVRCRGGRTKGGVVIVAAAGNGNCPLDHSGPHSAIYDVQRATGQIATSRTFRNVLARIPGVLHVAAVTAEGRRALYSGFGPGIDLCAPSSDGLPFAPETTVCGLTTTYGPPRRVTDQFKGTSGAAALVAGVAALVRSAAPHATANEVAELLCATATRSMPPWTELPADAPAWVRAPIEPFDDGAFDASGWSPWFGYGRVDALGAVRTAQAHRPSTAA